MLTRVKILSNENRISSPRGHNNPKCICTVQLKKLQLKLKLEWHIRGTLRPLSCNINYSKQQSTAAAPAAGRQPRQSETEVAQLIRSLHTLNSQLPATGACVHAKLLQSCPTLCNFMDCRLLGSSVHGILRQEYWSELPCPPPGHLPNPGIEFMSLMSPTLAGRFFTASTIWEPSCNRTLWLLQSLPNSCFSP